MTSTTNQQETQSHEILIELGCEELPAQALSELSQELAERLRASLDKQSLLLPGAQVQAYCSPRRLAVHVQGVAVKQPPQQIEKRGPAVSAGFDASGQASKALLGFAQSVGVDVGALEQLLTDKGSWFVYRATLPGQATTSLLPSLVSECLHALPVGKPMRWSDSSHAFLRPVHWLLALVDQQVIDTQAFGVRSGRVSFGHRFHAPQAISIAHPSDYQAALRNAQVEVDSQARRNSIIAQATKLAQQLGGVIRVPAILLDEVANLNEWPHAIACDLPAEFMTLPPETIVTTIETHQRYFPVYASATSNQLLPAFIGIANIASRDPSEIKKGYERVVRPRLADAKFFYDQDLKTPFVEFQTQLKQVTYQQKLGTLWDKSERVAKLAKFVAPAFGASPDDASQLALLAKADLMSRMVNEFPELQGYMGASYALQQGFPANHAAALEETYRPRQAGLAIAASALGRTLAVAERLDSIVGIFSVGLKPTGNKDAFALRRAALGLARTLIESDVSLDLLHAIQYSISLLPNAETTKPELADEVYGFIVERLRAYYQDQGIDALVLDAVAERKPVDLQDFDRRLRACQQFKMLPESAALVAANKRIRNILRKAYEADSNIALHVDCDKALLQLPAEHALVAAISETRTKVEPYFARAAYVEALQYLSTLREPIDSYFDAVMVMDEDAEVRLNRLRTLKMLSDLFLQIADVSVLG